MLFSQAASIACNGISNLFKESNMNKSLRIAKLVTARAVMGIGAGAVLATTAVAGSVQDFSHRYSYEGVGQVEHPNDTPFPEQRPFNRGVAGDIYSDVRMSTNGSVNNARGAAYTTVAQSNNSTQYYGGAQQYQEYNEQAQALEEYNQRHSEYLDEYNERNGPYFEGHNYGYPAPPSPPTPPGHNGHNNGQYYNYGNGYGYGNGNYHRPNRPHRPNYNDPYYNDDYFNQPPRPGYGRPDYRPNHPSYNHGNGMHRPYPPAYRPPMHRPYPPAGTTVRACVAVEKPDGSYTRDRPEHVIITDGHGIYSRYDYLPDGSLDNLFVLLNDHGHTRIIPLHNRTSLSKAPTILEDITGRYRYRISSTWRRCGN